tara:strand:+ start:805 stop:2889 length:2085 start_codon:yes stop_codon:yes gene_type:complete
MATIDRVVLRIEADLKDVNQKLSKFEKQVDNSTKKSSAGFKNIATVAKAALGAVVVQQIARATMSLVQFSGNIDELRSKSAAVFKEFTSGVRAELTAFGDTVGRSTHELEQMASTVQDTFVPLGFARGEAAKLSTNLTKLAVDVASFNNANDVETMEAFKSALVGNHEAVRRFGIVITETELKAELLRMGITKNSQEVDAATKVQARLNLIMAGTTDAQGDATRTAGSFANTSRALKAELSELADEVGLTLVPTFTKLTEKAISAAKAVRRFLLDIGVATARTDTLSEISSELDRLGENLDNFRRKADNEMINKIFKSLFNVDLSENSTLMKFQKEQIANLERLRNQRLKLIMNQKIATSTTENETKTNVKYDKALEKITNKTKHIVSLLDSKNHTHIRVQKFIEANFPKELEMTEEQEEAYKNQLKALLANTEMLENREKAIESAKSSVQSSITEEEALKTKIDELNFAYRDGAISIQDYERANEFLNKKLKEVTATTQELSTLDQEFIGVVDSLANKFESSFIDALSGTKSALEGFKDFSRQLVQEILRTYIRLSIINPIINSAFKAVPGFTPRDTMDGGAVVDRFIDIGKKAFGFAGGGTVQGRRPIIVGERGPEMFIPNTGGRIVPNGALGGSLRGGSPTIVNQSLNFATGIQNTVRAEVMNMMPLIQNATLQAVVDQKRRGGSFAQGMS